MANEKTEPKKDESALPGWLGFDDANGGPPSDEMFDIFAEPPTPAPKPDKK